MRRLYVIALVLSYLCMSCTKFEEDFIYSDVTQQQTRATIDAATLRESAGVANANNPYSVSNMNKAMIQYCKVLNIQPRPIYATHEYVRFQAKDSVDYYILEDSLKLEIFDYPLDRMLNSIEQDFYVNDVVNGKHWVYTVVPKATFRYPTEIVCEKLQDVFLYGDYILSSSTRTANAEIITPYIIGGGGNGPVTNTDEAFFDEILTLSMKNAGVEIIGGGASATAGVWTPTAFITYEEDLTNTTIPLVHIKVRINTFVNIGTGYTDGYGKVSIPKGWGGKFRNPVNYQIKFKSDEWKILDHNSGVAKIIGPQSSKGAWQYTIRRTDAEQSAYAAVHRALHYIYYNQDDIALPFALTKNRVAVYYDQHRDYYGKFYPTFELLGAFANPVRIVGLDRQGYNLSRFVLTGSTFHELGHASHWRQKGLNFAVYDDKVRESYARAVEYYFLSRLYPNSRRDSFMDSEDSIYTNIGEALLNQGITMSQLQDIVCQDSYTWTQFRQNVKESGLIPDYVVDILFDSPNQRWFFNVQYEAIKTEDDNYVAYAGLPILFEIQDPLERVNAKVTKWFTTPSDYKLTNTDEQSTYITFDRPDTYEVWAEIQLPDSKGTKYYTTRTITVKDLPSIVGNISPHVGVSTVYTIENDNFFNGWKIEYQDGTGQWKNATDNISASDKSKGTLDVIFWTPGNYRLTAKFTYDTINKERNLLIQVPTEGQPTSTRYAPGIYRVTTAKHKTNGSIVHQIYDKQFNQVKTGYDYLDKNFQFRAFNRRPSSEHPYYENLIQLYKFDYFGFEAYFNTTFLPASPDRPLNHYDGLKWEEAFFAFNYQVSGTIPIYSIELTAYDDNNSKISCSRMLSLEPMDGDVTWMNQHYRATNFGIMGYVYPIE